MCERSIVAVAVTVCTIGFTANAAVTTSWTDAGGNANWDTLANWSDGVPGSSDDAKHTSSLSDIQMNATTGECASFEGDGGNPTSRFMLIEAQKDLAIGSGGLDGSGTGKFRILMQDGITFDTTALTVAGAANDFSVSPARNHSADRVWVFIDGQVTNADITVGENAAVTLSSDSTADIVDVSITASQGSGISIGHLTTKTSATPARSTPIINRPAICNGDVSAWRRAG